MSSPSRADTKSRTDARTDSMWGWQPYPNLPVYVVHPIDWEGHSHTLHWNFLLPISQDEGKTAVEEASSNEPTLVSQEEAALLVDCPTESELESTPHSPSKQHKLVDPRADWVNHPRLCG